MLIHPSVPDARHRARARHLFDSGKGSEESRGNVDPSSGYARVPQAVLPERACDLAVGDAVAIVATVRRLKMRVERVGLAVVDTGGIRRIDGGGRVHDRGAGAVPHGARDPGSPNPKILAGVAAIGRREGSAGRGAPIAGRESIADGIWQAITPALVTSVGRRPGRAVGIGLAVVRAGLPCGLVCLPTVSTTGAGYDTRTRSTDSPRTRCASACAAGSPRCVPGCWSIRGAATGTARRVFPATPGQISTRAARAASGRSTAASKTAARTRRRVRLGRAIPREPACGFSAAADGKRDAGCDPNQDPSNPHWPHLQGVSIELTKSPARKAGPRFWPRRPGTRRRVYPRAQLMDHRIRTHGTAAYRSVKRGESNGWES
jgi:hypothetical protein